MYHQKDPQHYYHSAPVFHKTQDNRAVNGIRFCIRLELGIATSLGMASLLYELFPVTFPRVSPFLFFAPILSIIT